MPVWRVKALDFVVFGMVSRRPLNKSRIGPDLVTVCDFFVDCFFINKGPQGTPYIHGRVNIGPGWILWVRLFDDETFQFGDGFVDKPAKDEDLFVVFPKVRLIQHIQIGPFLPTVFLKIVIKLPVVAGGFFPGGRGNAFVVFV